MRSGLLTLVLVAAPIDAQTASYTYIDQPPPYSNPQWLVARNTPRIGQTFTLQVPPTTLYWDSYFLVTGASRIHFDLGTLRLPYWGTPYGIWFTDILALQATPSGGFQQSVTINFNIPNVMSLQGVQFYQQILGFVDLTRGICSACPPFVGASRGGHGIIGL